MTNVVQLETARVTRWAEKIHTAHAKSVDAILEVGRLLLQAKADCTHGEWGELTGRDGGKRLLPFSDRTVRAYMTIAKNPVFSNGHHGAHLPASWRTLAELAAIPAPVLADLIAEGEIHPEMERQDAIKLRQRHAPPQDPAQIPRNVAPKSPNPAQAVAAAMTLLDFSTIGPPLTDEDRAWIAKSDERIGNMIIGLCERQEATKRAAAEVRARFPSNPDTARAENLGLDLLSFLRQAADAIDRAQVPPLLLDAHRVQALADLAKISTVINEATP
jgi:hypothetical protein